MCEKEREGERGKRERGGQNARAQMRVKSILFFAVSINDSSVRIQHRSAIARQHFSNLIADRLAIGRRSQRLPEHTGRNTFQSWYAQPVSSIVTMS